MDGLALRWGAEQKPSGKYVYFDLAYMSERSPLSGLEAP